MNIDKAGKKYWDDVWAEDRLPVEVNPYLKGVINYPNRRFHKYFLEAFKEIKTSDMKLLEIGCAQSAWLPYFAKEFGFKVNGIDYSEIGCKKARKILLRSGVEGKIVCADFFSPPNDMYGVYDVVVSIGVVEHFDDTKLCIKALSKFLKPNGIMITVIPNMVGIIGLVQKILNRKIFDMHKIIDSETLQKTHEICGFEVLDCNYILFSNFYIINLKGLRIDSVEFLVKKNIMRLFLVSSLIGWFIENKVGVFKKNKFISSYVFCRGKKI
jgi:2-polyprenyl-3-methyl-5-hydroxy-6-metoxy-1,4-benzoquinol methylase